MCVRHWLEAKMAWGELPEGWEVKRLGEVGRYINGRAFKPEEWADEGLPIIRIQNLTDSAKPFNYCNQPVKAKYYVHDGDLLISWSASLGAFIWDRGDAVLNQHIFRVEVVEELVDKKFLYFVILHILEGLESRTHGSTMRHITKRKFEATEIPLPPLDKQRRIVARIEELTERIDAARRLRAEAAEEADAIVQMAALEAFRELESEEVPLGEVTDSSRYGTSKRASVEPIGYPMLRMNNITLDGRLDLADLKYVQLDERKFAKLRLHPGDIVVNRTNSKELVGKCTVFHVQDSDYVFASYLIRFRLNESEADSDYVVYYLSSPLGRGEIDARSHGATNQFNINAGELKSIPIPLPPLNEQRRIVEYLDAVQAEVEAIRR
jgi:type I restriction enzyme S subunit